MSTMKDGGPAFPAEITIDRATGAARPYQFNNDDFKVPGMTLRDYFAAKALQGILAHQGPNVTFDSDLVDVKVAYRMADAMLSAREVK